MKKITTTIMLAGCLALTGTSCKSHQPAEQVIKHMTQTGWAGSAGAYADRVPNSAVLKEDGGDTGATVFYCLRIGLYDSTDASDRKLEAAKEKYYEQDMYKDWVLNVNGDSIAPVFSQPVPHKQEKLTEQVLVYEIPKGSHPAMLIYKDPYKLLGLRQNMLLPENSN